MTEQERDYRERARRLLLAAGQTSDPTLRLVLATQSARVNMKALQIELARKQAQLTAWGIPLMA